MLLCSGNLLVRKINGRVSFISATPLPPEGFLSVGTEEEEARGCAPADIRYTAVAGEGAARWGYYSLIDSE